MNWNTAPARELDVAARSKSSSENDYAQFCNYLEKISGITLGDNKSYLVESRLKPIMEECRLRSLGELVRMLEEGIHLSLERRVVDAMTTNETSWFRDIYPFEYLKDNLLTAIPMTQARPFRIWSAACSYGHEPYSISIVVQEFLERNPGRIPAGLEIMGTDISPQVLEQAMSGLYRHFETERGLSTERRKKYFPQKEDGRQIRDDIKNRVYYRKHNLITNSFPLGTFDVIFCRNVMIYFSNKNKEEILKNIVRSLVPNGYLFLGGSEPLVNYSDQFNMVPSERGVVYQLKQGKKIW